jgi:hypothetical protein
VLESFGRKGRLRKAIRELEVSLASAPLKFATEVLDEYEQLNDQMGLENGEPQFARVAVTEASRGPNSHLNQMVLMLEGLCFFCHLLNRSTFRASSEALREVVLDPIVVAGARLHAEMIAAIWEGEGNPPSTDEILSHINDREAQYAAAAQFMGENAEDKSSVVGIAPGIIADMADRSGNEALIALIRLCLLRQVADFDWKGMVARAEANI